MSTYTISRPHGGKPTPLEAKHHPAYSWWRVAAPDGSTVAFTPDETTARFIANSLTASSAQYGLPFAGVGR